MMRLAVMLILMATASYPDTFPAAFFVTDVAEDDTLNIRKAPDPNAKVIGAYGPYALNIEVLRTTPDGKWGLVIAGESNGWTAMRFLERSDHQNPIAFPRPMRCFGTEPFWSLNVTTRGDEYQEMGFDRRDLTMISESVATNGAMATFAEGPTSSRTLMIKRGYCNDGMSDREFGWQATLFNDAPDESTVQSGCCSLDTNF